MSNIRYVKLIHYELLVCQEILSIRDMPHAVEEDKVVWTLRLLIGNLVSWNIKLNVPFTPRPSVALTIGLLGDCELCYGVEYRYANCSSGPLFEILVFSEHGALVWPLLGM